MNRPWRFPQTEEDIPEPQRGKEVTVPDGRKMLAVCGGLNCVRRLEDALVRMGLSLERQTGSQQGWISVEGRNVEVQFMFCSNHCGACPMTFGPDQIQGVFFAHGGDFLIAPPRDRYNDGFAEAFVVKLTEHLAKSKN